MSSRHVFISLVMILKSALALAAEGKPVTPVEARKQVGKKVTVEMVVQAAKDRLEKRGKIYLDSETDFKGEKIRATGTVKEVDEIPRVEIDDAGQIRLVEGH